MQEFGAAGVAALQQGVVGKAKQRSSREEPSEAQCLGG